MHKIMGLCLFWEPFLYLYDGSIEVFLSPIKYGVLNFTGRSNSLVTA